MLADWEERSKVSVQGTSVTSPQIPRSGEFPLPIRPLPPIFPAHSPGDGSVAQLVEQGIENPCVGRSNRPRATFTVNGLRGKVLGFLERRIIDLGHFLATFSTSR